MFSEMISITGFLTPVCFFVQKMHAVFRNSFYVSTKYIVCERSQQPVPILPSLSIPSIFECRLILLVSIAIFFYLEVDLQIQRVRQDSLYDQSTSSRRNQTFHYVSSAFLYLAGDLNARSLGH
jgi:hypothetical protein